MASRSPEDLQCKGVVPCVSIMRFNGGRCIRYYVLLFLVLYRQDLWHILFNITLLKFNLNLHCTFGLSPSVKGRFSAGWGSFGVHSSLRTDVSIRSLRRHLTAVF